MSNQQNFSEIIKNMDRMGWMVTPVNGSGGYSFKVAPPGKPTVTISIRQGHGSATQNTLAAIKGTGYFEAWESHQNAQRAARMAGAAKAAVPPAPEPTNGTPPDSRDRVGGRAVVERARAKDNPPGAGGRIVEISGVDELLLEDETVVYQCTRSDRCFEVFDNVKSCVSHLRKHGTRTESARRDMRYAAQSAAGQQAQAVIRERRARLIDDETRANWLLAAADQLEQMVPMLRQLTRITVDAPEPPAPLIGEEELAELRRKAAKWDNFIAMTRE